MNTKVITFIVLAFFSALVFSEPTQQLPTKGTGPWIVNVYYKDLKQLQDYANQGDVWKVERKAKYFITSVANLHEYQQLFSYGFTVEVNQKQMEYKREDDLRRILDKSSSTGIKSIPGFVCERTVEETFATIDSLVATYPTLVTNIDVGDTWEKTHAGGQSNGYDLRVIKITNSAIAGPKPKLFVTSSMHARELAPAELNTRFAEYLLNNYGTDADATWIVDHREVHLMLQANPDGRKRAESADTNKRKNQNNNHCSGSNTRGIDMNRNFIWMWNQGSGSSGSVCNQTYRGPSAQSESENQAIDTHLKSLFIDARGNNLADAAPDTTTGVYIDIHSEASLILWPYGFDDPSVIPEAPNHDQLQTLGRKFGWYNGYFPEKSNELYGADGAADDNAYGQLGVAAYTFELGGDAATFRPTCNYVDNTLVPDNLKALIYAAKVVKTPYITASGPDVEALGLSSDYVVAGTLVQLNGTASDLHFNNTNTSVAHPAEMSQNISTIELFVDEFPEDAGSTPINLSATDGSFDATVEAFSGSIDTTGFALGQHVFYIQATDVAGVTGVLYARYFNVVNAADLGTLSGTITDATTNLPIDAVMLNYNGLQASSDASGHYSFSSLASTADLMVSKQGYASQAIGNVSIVASQATIQNIQLQPLCALLDESVETFNVIADAQTAGWSHGKSAGVDDWAINLTNGNSAPHAFSTSDPGATTDKWLISPAMDLTADSVLSFWHKFGFEGNSPYYDGGVLEIATNASFNNWVDLGNLSSVGGYNVTLNSGNPLGAVAAWGGSQSTFQKVEVALSSFAGTTAKIRWRMAADSTVGGTAPWIIDDIQVLDPSACSAVNPDVLFLNGFE